MQLTTLNVACFKIDASKYFLEKVRNYSQRVNIVLPGKYIMQLYNRLI